MADLGDLAVRLASLGSDLGSGDLAGPVAARDRARQRTRRHRAGAVVVVAAAAIGVIASPLEVWSGPGSEAGPPASSPAASPETLELTALPETVLLSPDDLEDDAAPAEWEVVAPWAGEGPHPCAPGAGDDALQVLQRSFEPSDEGRIDQVVERFDDATEAQERFTEIWTTGAECAPELEIDSGGPPESWTLTGVGDEAWVTGFWTPAIEGDSHFRVELALVRTGTAVTSITWGFFAQDAIDPVTVDLAAAATTRLCEPAGGTCVDNPRVETESTDLEFSATRQLLFEAAQRHFDPDGKHLGFESQGGMVTEGTDDIHIAAKLEWTNPGEPGTGLVEVGVSTPGMDVADIAINQGCEDLATDCPQQQIPGASDTAWVGGRDAATGRQFAIVYIRPDGVIVTAAVYNLFGNTSVEPVSDIAIALEDAFAFVLDRELEVHPDGSPRE